MFEVDLFGNKVLLSGKLLHTQVDSLLQLCDFLSEFFPFFVEDSDGLLVFLVLFEQTGEFLFLNHYLVEDGGVIDQVTALQFGVTL